MVVAGVESNKQPILNREREKNAGGGGSAEGETRLMRAGSLDGPIGAPMPALVLLFITHKTTAAVLFNMPTGRRPSSTSNKRKTHNKTKNAKHQPQNVKGKQKIPQ